MINCEPEYAGCGCIFGVLGLLWGSIFVSYCSNSKYITATRTTQEYTLVQKVQETDFACSGDENKALVWGTTEDGLTSFQRLYGSDYEQCRRDQLVLIGQDSLIITGYPQKGEDGKHIVDDWKPVTVNPEMTTQH